MRKRSLKHRNMGSLEVIAIGDATEEWILLLLVVEFLVIPAKEKGIDLKIERQPWILSCLAALVDFIRNCAPIMIAKLSSVFTRGDFRWRCKRR